MAVAVLQYCIYSTYTGDISRKTKFKAVMSPYTLYNNVSKQRGSQRTCFLKHCLLMEWSVWVGDHKTRANDVKGCINMHWIGISER